MNLQEFYLNQPLNHECFKLPEKDKKYLVKNNFLNEYFTKEDKAQVRSNLGITSLLDELKSLILSKIFDEEGNITFDLEPHEDAFNKVLSSSTIYKILLKYYTKEELDEWREHFIDEIYERILGIQDNIRVDNELNEESEYPVQNKVLYNTITLINEAYSRLDNLKTNKEELLNYYTIDEINDLLTLFENKIPEFSGFVLSDWEEEDPSKIEYINNKPNLSTVAISGSYNDLIDKPTIPSNVSDLINDAGYLTTHLDISNKVDASDLSIVATSGDYNDLSNKPLLGSAASKDIPSDGNANNDEVVLGNDSRLSDSRTPVAHNHTVSEITDFPASMPASDVSSWAKQAEKPSYSYSEISGTPILSTVAISGSYSDLINKPTNVSSFINDSGYLTQHQDISGKAEKSEMNVVAGTGVNSDKTTITLKSGTSATVLTTHQSLNGKLDVINDLETIRSGASAGATAYLKPNAGIPKTDLSEGVLTSLDKADTALLSHLDITGKADKVQSAVNNNFAGLDANGNLKDSGKKSSDFATAAQGTKADTAYLKPSGGIPSTDMTQAVQNTLTQVGTNTGAISDINGLIPSQATTENQLADKEFVNSSVSTATATYRGSKNLVSDLSLTISATESLVITALLSAITTKDNNDYCFVQVPTTDETPTVIARVDRYKYNGTAWVFEYSLNNSGFTVALWNALNSGITNGLVSKLSALPTNNELTTLLNGKLNVIDSDHKLDYSLLSNTPTIPDAQIQSDWSLTNSSSKDFIKNKPTLGSAAAKNVPSSGNASTTEVVMGNDSRLSDSRTPTSHTHGNITNSGTLNDTAAAAAGNDYVVIRDADNNNILTSTIKGTDVADAVSKKHTHTSLTLSTTAQAYDGDKTLALPANDPYTSARTPSSHTHGNITNAGALQTTDVTIANGDKLVVTDNSDSDKVARASVAFGTGTTTYLRNDGTWATPGIVILKYGISTWNDFITAYNNKNIVYCRASSEANPASGVQTRLAFMTYVNQETNPTNVEFLYYRSMTSHTDALLGDLVFVYKLDRSNGWSLTTRNISAKVVAGTNLTSTYNNDTITVNAPGVFGASGTNHAIGFVPDPGSTAGTTKFLREDGTWQEVIVDNSDTERVIAAALNDLNLRINNLDIPEISTNIVTDKASNVKAASPKAVYDEIHPAVQSSQPLGGMLPNVMYTLGTLTGSVTFTLAAGTSGIVNHYYWTFDTGSTAPTITWPSGLTWNGGSAPTITASKHYEISVLNNVAIYILV